MNQIEASAAEQLTGGTLEERFGALMAFAFIGGMTGGSGWVVAAFLMGGTAIALD